METISKILYIILIMLTLNACSTNQVSSKSHADGHYSINKNAWGAAIGGGSGVLISD